MAVREGKKATAARQLRGKSSKSNSFSKAQPSASQTASTDQEPSGTHSNQHLGQHLLLANSAQPGAPCASGHADLLSLLPSRRARVLRIVGNAVYTMGHPGKREWLWSQNCGGMQVKMRRNKAADAANTQERCCNTGNASDTALQHSRAVVLKSVPKSGPKHETKRSYSSRAILGWFRCVLTVSEGFRGWLRFRAVSVDVVWFRVVSARFLLISVFRAVSCGFGVVSMGRFRWLGT